MKIMIVMMMITNDDTDMQEKFLDFTQLVIVDVDTIAFACSELDALQFIFADWLDGKLLSRSIVDFFLFVIAPS